jgi:hypothetical protein
VSDLVISDPVRRAELAARTWRSVDLPKAGARRCWRWRGDLTSRGDPRIQLDARRGTTVRRLVWILYRADPARGLAGTAIVTPTCLDRMCVRPDHLRLFDCRIAQARAAREARAVA